MEIITSGKSKDCNKCINFVAHPNYPYLMICLEKQQVVSLPREACKDYVEKSWDKLVELLSEKGFLYCAKCSKLIYSLDELNKHKSDFILFEFFPDDVAYEESPVAD
ncbi:MAG: hypothetical protein QXF09_00100 [Nitrososphaerota archaeon]